LALLRAPDAAFLDERVLGEDWDFGRVSSFNIAVC